MLQILSYNTDEFTQKQADMFEGTHKIFIEKLIELANSDDTDCVSSYQVLNKLFDIKADWNTTRGEYLSVTDGYGQDIEAKLSDYGHDVLHGGV